VRTLVAGMIIAMLASTACAQDASSLQNTEQKAADKAKQKAADEAYKAALKRIPDPKEKYDPWQNAR
jgi:hypothetical protein